MHDILRTYWDTIHHRLWLYIDILQVSVKDFSFKLRKYLDFTKTLRNHLTEFPANIID